MTDQQPTDISAVLDRVHQTVFRSRVVTTDGFPYHPDREVAAIGADLGYTRRPDAEWPRKPHGTFQADIDAAKHWRESRCTDALRVLQRAGANPHDVETLRSALGLEPENEILRGIVDDIDQHNAEVRQYYIEEYKQLQAIAVSNASEEGRCEALQEAYDLTGDRRFADKLRAMGREPAPKTVDISLGAHIKASRDSILITLATRSQQLASLFAGMTVVSASHERLVLSARYPKHAEMILAKSDLVLAAVEEKIGVAIERLEVQVNDEGHAGS